MALAAAAPSVDNRGEEDGSSSDEEVNESVVASSCLLRGLPLFLGTSIFDPES